MRWNHVTIHHQPKTLILKQVASPDLPKIASLCLSSCKLMLTARVTQQSIIDLFLNPSQLEQPAVVLLQLYWVTRCVCWAATSSSNRAHRLQREHYPTPFTDGRSQVDAKWSDQRHSWREKPYSWPNAQWRQWQCSAESNEPSLPSVIYQQGPQMLWQIWARRDVQKRKEEKTRCRTQEEREIPVLTLQQQREGQSCSLPRPNQQRYFFSFFFFFFWISPIFHFRKWEWHCIHSFPTPKGRKHKPRTHCWE